MTKRSSPGVHEGPILLLQVLPSRRRPALFANSFVFLELANVKDTNSGHESYLNWCGHFNPFDSFVGYSAKNCLPSIIGLAAILGVRISALWVRTPFPSGVVLGYFRKLASLVIELLLLRFPILFDETTILHCIAVQI